MLRKCIRCILYAGFQSSESCHITILLRSYPKRVSFVWLVQVGSIMCPHRRRQQQPSSSLINASCTARDVIPPCFIFALQAPQIYFFACLAKTIANSFHAADWQFILLSEVYFYATFLWAVVPCGLSCVVPKCSLKLYFLQGNYSWHALKCCTYNTRS